MPKGIPKNGINKGWFRKGDKGYWFGKDRPEIRTWLPQKPSKATRKKIAEANRRDIEENARRWKGDDVGYDGLHKWVSKHRGNPKKCEHCGIDDKKRWYHWANKSHEYKRDLEDWMRLCVPCHMKYDKNN